MKKQLRLIILIIIISIAYAPTPYLCSGQCKFQSGSSCTISADPTACTNCEAPFGLTPVAGSCILPSTHDLSYVGNGIAVNATTPAYTCGSLTMYSTRITWTDYLQVTIPPITKPHYSIIFIAQVIS